MTDLDIALRGEPTLGEGPTWDVGTGSLVWVDILGSAVHRFHPGPGTDEVIEVPQAASSRGSTRAGAPGSCCRR